MMMTNDLPDEQPKISKKLCSIAIIPIAVLLYLCCTVSQAQADSSKTATKQQAQEAHGCVATLTKLDLLIYFPSSYKSSLVLYTKKRIPKGAKITEVVLEHTEVDPSELYVLQERHPQVVTAYCAALGKTAKTELPKGHLLDLHDFAECDDKKVLEELGIQQNKIEETRHRITLEQDKTSQP